MKPKAHTHINVIQVPRIISDLEDRIQSNVTISNSIGPRGVWLFVVEANCTGVIGCGKTVEEAAKAFIRNMGLAD